MLVKNKLFKISKIDSITYIKYLSINKLVSSYKYESQSKIFNSITIEYRLLNKDIIYLFNISSYKK